MQVAPQRLVIRHRMAEICDGDPGWQTQPAEWKETAIRRMERSCFAVVVDECTRDGIDRIFTEPKFISRYSLACARVIANLDKIHDDYLISSIIDGSVDPINVGSMTSEQLCPNANSRSRAEIDRRRHQKTNNKVSRAYRCRICGMNETVYLEYQARCADEGSSKSVKCVNPSCGNVWRC